MSELRSEVVRWESILGIYVVFLPQLPGTYLDGAALMDPLGRPVVALTLRHDRIDSSWFTLFHELSHIHLHLGDLTAGAYGFVDDIDLPSEERRETEADTLARTASIPDMVLQQVRWQPSSTTDDLTRVATRSRVHLAIVAGRWQREFRKYRKFARLVERGTLRERFL